MPAREVRLGRDRSPGVTIRAWAGWRRVTASPDLPRLSVALVAFVLVGCETLGFTSGGRGEAPVVEQPVLVCPRVASPSDTADLVRFRTPESRDLTDLVVSARITSLNGTCALVNRNAAVQVTVTMGVEAMRGPAAPGRTIQLPYFVAVTGPDEEVLDKAVYTLAVEFPANMQRARMQGEEIRLTIPVTAERPASANRVYVGFQLTEQELALNRSRVVAR